MKFQKEEGDGRGGGREEMNLGKERENGEEDGWDLKKDELSFSKRKEMGGGEEGRKWTWGKREREWGSGKMGFEEG